jgi:hypothetical protein
MTLKEALKYQIKEYKEIAKKQWFWVFYILVITILNYFGIK